MNTRLLNLYGLITDAEVRVFQNPRRAVAEFRLDDKQHRLQFEAPRPYTALMDLFDDCWSIRIYDRNFEEQNCLEFGRYRVELGDEDNPISEFVVDRFEHLAAG